MAAYIFIKEKLGVNVTFYPTTDYDDIWNNVHWMDDNNVFQYPRNYFEWISNDAIDLNFELWPSQVTEYESQYVSTGLVDIDYNGASAELSVFIPKYVYDLYPSITIPFNIQTNSTYRELIINGSALGAMDYIYLYSQNNTDFDSPNYQIPTVWCSYDQYANNQYGYNLVKNSGMNVSFTSIGSELLLRELIQDLYSQRLTFLFNSYSMDDNFGTFDSVTGELMEFVKLSFPTSPHQNTNDSCVIAAECEYPKAKNLKALNPALSMKSRLIYSFAEAFSMNETQINLLVAHYWNTSATNLPSSTERWLTAACAWFNDENSFSTWTAWNLSLDWSTNSPTSPTNYPTNSPTPPTDYPTNLPTPPTDYPTNYPTNSPTFATYSPTHLPTSPTYSPTTQNITIDSDSVSTGTTLNIYVLYFVAIFVSIIALCCLIYFCFSNLLSRTQQPGTASFIGTIKVMGCFFVCSLALEIFDIVVDYLYAVELITNENEDVVKLGWISLLCAIIGLILFGIKTLIAKKLLGYQEVELKKELKYVHETKMVNAEKIKLTKRIIGDIRARYVDLDVLSLFISCIEDVPQATIALIYVLSTEDWNSISILTMSKSMASFFWKLSQVMTSNFGCKDPDDITLSQPKFEVITNINISAEE
eukprot:330402_1